MAGRTLEAGAMTNLLVDTDVVSFIFKNDTRAGLYAAHLAGNRLH